MFAFPEDWTTESKQQAQQIISYKDNVAFSEEHLKFAKQSAWFAISNGRFTAQVNNELLNKLLSETKADVIAVNASCELLACREKVRLTPNGKLAGFRRFYYDYAQPAALVLDWPHHVFIKSGIIDDLLQKNDTLPQTFSELLKTARVNNLKIQSVDIAGTSFDLSTEHGLLSIVSDRIDSTSTKSNTLKLGRNDSDKNGVKVSPDARVIGKVSFGTDTTVGRNAIVVGPAIIGDNVKIEDGAVVMSSIIAPNIKVSRNQVICDRILLDSVVECQSQQRQKNKQIQPQLSRKARSNFDDTTNMNIRPVNFRTWPKLSYACFFKRFADICIAATILLLFAPVLPIIALVVKLTSKGPVFFKDKRQGLHGRDFHCLKFRTMLVGADRIQDKLRTLNLADGPQFKMDDDPRISTIGRFLRDTYIDEIPQFFNVLRGQMSVVGPRPSPESENTLCPYWRDARLSVRPGITGLWQVCRTRQPMRDFQEWIFYDTKYVRELSPKMDLWICLQTARKFLSNFISQF
jgi:lipopolysaccharide/colanic/teichoic acid biosynthesis glycosyltransferase/carbonic anhydrase/acetyltransferase-like protein (isoleucine patch superfamily)